MKNLKLTALQQQLKQAKARVAYYNKLRGFRSCELSKQCVNINPDQMRRLSHEIDRVNYLTSKIKEIKDELRYAHVVIDLDL